VEVEAEQLLARVGVPDLAGAVIAARDKAVTVLVECAVSEGQQVSAQHFKERELLLLVLQLLLNQLYGTQTDKG
jgi:hypothetical protein